jgi:DNA repair exonuclease SbcCD ATPase subunit
MHIEFEKIEIFNFKSFDTEVFEFNKLKGMNLICGKNNDVPNSKNAAGKSTIFNALVFSLFGQTQENINNKNIANKFSKSKEVRVTTYFTIDENQYIVSSGFNKYGNAFCELKMKEKGQTDELDITKSTIQETRKFLE